MRDRADVDDRDVGAVRSQRRLAVPGVGNDGVAVAPRRIQADRDVRVPVAGGVVDPQAAQQAAGGVVEQAEEPWRQQRADGGGVADRGRLSVW